MRITNNIIVKNSKYNINSNKVNVDKYNTQMSSNKKISRASEDPVVAIRALRLTDNLSEVNQYYEKNIPDAESWIDMTETALINMKSIINDIYENCVNGSTDTLTSTDRNAILKNLEALKAQFYEEGNTDYAGRTVFTGYKTNSTLTFTEQTSDYSYTITQGSGLGTDTLTYSDIEEHTYFANSVTVPTTPTQVGTNVPSSSVTDITDPSAMPQTVTLERIRLAYDNISNLSSLSYTYTDADNNEQVVDLSTSVTSTNSADFEATGYAVGDNDVIFLEDTGELILGANVSADIKNNRASLSVTYDKTTFEEGELRPEHYYNCTRTDSAGTVTFTRENQAIEYTVATGQTITVNTQASDIFDSDIYRDLTEITDAVNYAIAAEEKIAQIQSMMEQEQYSDETYQTNLKAWLAAAQKESDYANEYMQNIFSSAIGNFSGYLNDVNLGITDLGSRAQRLALTKERVLSQQENLEDLKSSNEDRDVSDIIIDYTSAYNAYTASLQAASKIEQTSLLNYL